LLPVVFAPGRPGPFNLLCLGAHADDIEIGCGGTILRLVEELPDLCVRWIVFSGDEGRAAEARKSAATFLREITRSSIDTFRFRDGYFPFQGSDIKDVFEALKREFSPSLILTHRKDDAHQDHRLISELTYNTFRDHLILEYEIPKYEGDLANPNFFVPLLKRQVAKKVAIIGECFPSQHGRGWFTDDTFLALARLRGIGCRAPEGVAEAFQAHKLVFQSATMGEP
jgi:LmbE family N-acetylglucosaminyl deacetylase